MTEKQLLVHGLPEAERRRWALIAEAYLQNIHMQKAEQTAWDGLIIQQKANMLYLNSLRPRFRLVERCATSLLTIKQQFTRETRETLFREWQHGVDRIAAEATDDMLRILDAMKADAEERLITVSEQRSELAYVRGIDYPPAKRHRPA